MQGSVKFCCISNCLSSSREKMMSRRGLKRSRMVRAYFLPKEPVPPVIRIDLPFNILRCSQCRFGPGSSNLFRRGRTRLAADEPYSVQRQVDVETSLQHRRSEEQPSELQSLMRI